MRSSPIPEKSADIENGIIVEEQLASSSPSPSSNGADGLPIELEDTPFFHFDLASAVRAAEHNLFRPVTSESSTHKSEDDLKVAISGHDIITTEIAQR